MELFFLICALDSPTRTLACFPVFPLCTWSQLDAKFLERWESGERGRLVRPSALAGGCWDLQMFVLTGSRLVSNLSAQMLGLGADMLRVAVLRGTSIDRVGQLRPHWVCACRRLPPMGCECLCRQNGFSGTSCVGLTKGAPVVDYPHFLNRNYPFPTPLSSTICVRHFVIPRKSATKIHR